MLINCLKYFRREIQINWNSLHKECNFWKLYEDLKEVESSAWMGMILINYLFEEILSYFTNL